MGVDVDKSTHRRQVGESDCELSVVILTRDEEKNLPFALASLEPLGATVFVVDSGSQDRTREIAQQAGCVVISHEFVNYATQLNWALDNLDIATRWVMRLDADERLTPELTEELAATLPRFPNDVVGLMVRRRVYFWGKWIRHGGYYPTWLLRVWRTGRGRCEDRWMDEHIVLDSGRTHRLAHDLIDENHKGLGFWVDKHNGYAEREVEDLLTMDRGNDPQSGILEGQARRRRWLKIKIYGRAPLFARAVMYWGYRYFLRLGFLDGVPGMVFHFFQGFWYRFLIDAKLYERTESEKKR